MNSKLFSIGIKRYNDLWELRTVYLSLDINNYFHPIWPIHIQWSDGVTGKFLKESINKRMLYIEVSECL